MKARIRDIMSYKKPKFYVFLAAALFGIVVFGPEDGVYGPDVLVERLDSNINPDTNETEIAVYLIHE